MRTGLALLLTAALLTGLWSPAAAAAHGPRSGGRSGSAWLPYWGDIDAAYRDALRHAAQLHTVSPFWYETSSDTTVKGTRARAGATSSTGCTTPGSMSCPP
ncbi:hypothetical protein Srufu_009760 [Streptomyces libani subsp. rufus]|nr:hypothetical protein Srufu_009760 [Streptomyces libani subsp. rufus]